MSRLPRVSVTPTGLGVVRRHNYRMAIYDSVAVGFSSAAAPYLPVFLARLGATAFAVSLLTAMPALTGLLLAIPIGRHLQRQRSIVPIFSLARGINQAAYAATAIVSIVAPPDLIVPAVLVVWAVATIPQTISMVGFSVVMDGIAGPRGRYELMSRRWSVLGLTIAITVAVVGLVLDQIGFPINFQLVFLVLSLGGFAAWWFSSRIRLPEVDPAPAAGGGSRVERTRGFVSRIRGEGPFVSVMLRRLVFNAGVRLALPLIPLYYVRVVNASDAWIGVFAMSQSLSILVGYWLWRRVWRRRGGRFVLLSVTFVTALQPAALALTGTELAVAVVMGVAAIFQAGVDLAFFDELMKTVPVGEGATFVAVDQTVQNTVGVAAPLIGALLADRIGIGGALIVASIVSLVGAASFLVDRGGRPGPVGSQEAA